jgi:hypothetical protein
MSIDDMKAFIRNHFEQFVNRKNLDVADVNFASDFVDHGANVPPGTPVVRKNSIREAEITEKSSI